MKKKKNSLEKFVNILTNYDFIGEIEKCPKNMKPFLYKQVYEMYKKENKLIENIKNKNKNLTMNN